MSTLDQDIAAFWNDKIRAIGAAAGMTWNGKDDQPNYDQITEYVRDLYRDRVHHMDGFDYYTEGADGESSSGTYVFDKDQGWSMERIEREQRIPEYGGGCNHEHDCCGCWFVCHHKIEETESFIILRIHWTRNV